MLIIRPDQAENIIRALKQGKVVVIPTETSYGLAVDAGNARAVKRLYRIKGRDFKKPVHVLVSSRAQAKQLIQWNKNIDALAKNFWPGPLTIVSKLKVASSATRRGGGLKGVSRGPLDTLMAGTGFLGVRMSPSKIVLNILKKFKHPITATSANVAGKPDCYSVDNVMRQFRGNLNKPDILVDGGILPHRKPSTLVKIDGKNIEILREGLISEKEILKIFEL